MGFKKAERRKAKLRLALSGTSGSGKTYSSLLIAKGIGGKIAMVDTESGSGELYANLCDYDVMQIGAPFTVEKYIQAIHEAEKSGYGVLIIDSLSHAWNGPGGLLEQQRQLAATKYKGNSWTAWKDITPQQDRLIQGILQSQIHIIATMRSKTEYMQTDDKKIKKLGTAPVQRDGLEYEFTVMLDIDQETHLASASKDRTSLFDNKVITLSEDVGKTLLSWLENGVEVLATQSQLKELTVKAKEYGLSSSDMKQIMSYKYGIESSKELTVDKAREMIDRLDALWEETIKGNDYLTDRHDDAALDAALDEAIQK